MKLKRGIILWAAFAVLFICGVAYALDWSDYDDFAAGQIDNADTFLVRDKSVPEGSPSAQTVKEYSWLLMKADGKTYFDTLYVLQSTLGVDPGDTLQAPADPAAHALFGFDNTNNIYRPILIGTNLTYDQPTNTLSASGSGAVDDITGDTVDDSKLDNALVAPPALQSVTCTDTGTGAAGALTITPTAGLGRVDISMTVNDADGCTITMGETDAVAGTLVIITNISAANTATFTTSANVITLKRGSPYVMGANESIILRRMAAEWLEVGRSGSELLTILDDAAQFANAADTSKKVKIDPSNQGAGQTGTIQAPVNGTATLVAGTMALVGQTTTAADPDVSATDRFSHDTDGANVTSDASWRAYDGANQYLIARKLKCIHATAIKPQDWADAARDKFVIWENLTGMTFTIVSWRGTSGTDNTTLDIKEMDADGANPATVDAVEIATDGTGLFYGSDTTITAATIPAGDMIYLDFDDTDDPAWVKMSICGWFDANID